MGVPYAEYLIPLHHIARRIQQNAHVTTPVLAVVGGLFHDPIRRTRPPVGHVAAAQQHRIDGAGTTHAAHAGVVVIELFLGVGVAFAIGLDYAPPLAVAESVPRIVGGVLDGRVRIHIVVPADAVAETVVGVRCTRLGAGPQQGFRYACIAKPKAAWPCHPPLSHRSQKSEKPLLVQGFSSSGAEEGRTPDLVIANDALYQLSYRPMMLPGPPRSVVGRRVYAV